MEISLECICNLWLVEVDLRCANGVERYGRSVVDSIRWNVANHIWSGLLGDSARYFVEVSPIPDCFRVQRVSIPLSNLSGHRLGRYWFRDNPPCLFSRLAPQTCLIKLMGQSCDLAIKIPVTTSTRYPHCRLRSRALLDRQSTNTVCGREVQGTTSCVPCVYTWMVSDSLDHFHCTDEHAPTMLTSVHREDSWRNFPSYK